MVGELYKKAVDASLRLQDARLKIFTKLVDFVVETKPGSRVTEMFELFIERTKEIPYIYYRMRMEKFVNEKILGKGGK